MENKARQLQISLTQEFAAYTTTLDERDEGAYVFVPGVERPEPVRENKPVAIKVIRVNTLN